MLWIPLSESPPNEESSLMIAVPTGFELSMNRRELIYPGRTCAAESLRSGPMTARRANQRRKYGRRAIKFFEMYLALPECDQS
mmetsp:Transcript_26732/g.56044  ORF Transcript_26732/g.56044 Transcript_26732/m.56044 type:complete len:83 (+) Transcript_26732:4705-4953(+)